MGDFNLVLRPSDKSTTNFNASEAQIFSSAINSINLQEIPLLDRLFTWSNQQDNPTLVRLDRSFVNLDWTLMFPDSTLSSLVRTTSDHVPILLTATTTIPKPSIFWLNNCLLSNPSFLQQIASNWASVGPNHRSLGSSGRLCLKLKRTRNMAKQWAVNAKAPRRMATNCTTTISVLDKLEEVRPLSTLELTLRIAVKVALHRHNNLLAAYWRQRAKIRDCTLDRRRKFCLHAYACGRAFVRFRKNQIPLLHVNGTDVTSHNGKEAILHTYFSSLLGTQSASVISFDLDDLMISSKLTPSQATSIAH